MGKVYLPSCQLSESLAYHNVSSEPQSILNYTSAHQVRFGRIGGSPLYFTSSKQDSCKKKKKKLVKSD